MHRRGERSIADFLIVKLPQDFRKCRLPWRTKPPSARHPLLPQAPTSAESTVSVKQHKSDTKHSRNQEVSATASGKGSD
ncbi:hypothetical protein MTO96_033786, partial [Rhipicephalus appendiculatus]